MTAMQTPEPGRKSAISPAEAKILSQIENLIAGDAATEAIQQAVATIEEQLQADPEKQAVSLPITLEVFGPNLSDEFLTCRAFGIRAGEKLKIERHTNSHQRMLTLKGGGLVYILRSQGWELCHQHSGQEISLEEKWVSIDPEVWHLPVGGPKGWIGLAFHTATQEELIDDFSYTGVLPEGI